MCIFDFIALVVCCVIVGQTAGPRGIPTGLAMAGMVIVCGFAWLLASAVVNPLVTPLVILFTGAAVIFIMSLIPKTDPDDVVADYQPRHRSSESETKCPNCGRTVWKSAVRCPACETALNQGD